MIEQWLANTLDDLKARNLFRELRQLDSAPGPVVRLGGQDLLNLSSNNYLDLAAHPAIKDAVCQAVGEWGWGSGASALISGHTRLHENLCTALAAFEKTEDAVFFPTGYQANVGVLCALAGADDRVCLDKLCHASIIDGARQSGATVRVFPHADCAKLERLLERPWQGKTLVVTDSIFSMDGDCAPLAEIATLCQRYDATLVVDEAHATGVLGENGSGATEWLHLHNQIPVRVGTLSKALGGMGGFVVGSRLLCDMLRNHARSLIYTTAPPPAVAAGALAALKLIEVEPWRREAALTRGQTFAARLRSGGLTVPDTPSPIVPVVVENEDKALALSAHLLSHNILAPAIRPPTVPRGTSRLRFSWMTTHTEEDVRHAANIVLSFLA